MEGPPLGAKDFKMCLKANRKIGCTCLYCERTICFEDCAWSYYFEGKICITLETDGLFLQRALVRRPCLWRPQEPPSLVTAPYQNYSKTLTEAVMASDQRRGTIQRDAQDRATTLYK